MAVPAGPDLLTEVAGGWTAGLLDASVRGTVLLLAALAAGWALRSRPAATRHLVWAATLAGLLALPLLSAVLPSISVPGLPSAETVLGTRGAPEAWQQEVGTGPDLGGNRSGPARSDGGEASVADGPVPASPGGRREGPSTLAVVAGLWLLGALSVLGRAAAARLRVWWMARAATPVRDVGWLRIRDRLTRRLGLRREVELLRGSASAVPMTWGVVRPRVLLPPESRGWPESCRRNVLLHELAHVRRGDYAMRLIGRVAVALYWFHPLAWVALRRLRRTQEEACDDHVLRAGARPSDYAGQLLRLARRLRVVGSGDSAAGSGARSSEFSRRLRSMLRSDRALRPVPRSRQAAAVGASAALVAALASVAPADEASVGATPPTGSASRAAPGLAAGDTVPRPGTTDAPGPLPFALRPDGGEEAGEGGAGAAVSRTAGSGPSGEAPEGDDPGRPDSAAADSSEEAGAGATGSEGPAGQPPTRPEPLRLHDGRSPLARAALDTWPELDLGVPGRPGDRASRREGPADTPAASDAALCPAPCTVEGTLRRLRRRHDPGARLDLLRRLARSPSGRAGAVLMEVSLRAARAEDRRLAVRALATVGGKVGDRYLFQVARANPWASVRAAAVDELGRSGGDDVVPWLVTLAYTDVTPAVQKFTVSVLARLDRTGAGSGLLQIARSHPEDGVRREAIYWLLRTGRDQALARLVDSA